ncbi:MAG TPA: hemolysin family protein [Rectinemataceae bacterium]|nr:hemolysin family protein [Rectinemataceae bacterium]
MNELIRSLASRLGLKKDTGSFVPPIGEQGGDADSEAAASEEVLDAQEERREMIRGVQELGTTLVKEVMVPRTDTFFVALDAKRDELLEAVVSSGHSRIPVYRETIDDVVGMLYAKDLLKILVTGEEFSLPALLRKPFFVPETKRIDALLREFKRRRVHIAVAVDEYGGVSGIVCLEDIIEEIVGEIQDEYDEEREEIVPVGESAWLCDARVNLDTFNGRTGLALPAEDFDSLGGYVFDLFGRIPLRGETIAAGEVEFTVQETEGHRIELVRVTRREDSGGIT